MAISPAASYPGRVDTSDPTGYPLGAFQNETAPAANDGTPSDVLWGNDLQGFLQSLLTEASVIPSGTPDKVGASQYSDALKLIFAQLTDARFPTTDEKAALVGTSGAPSVANPYVTDADSRLGTSGLITHAVALIDMTGTASLIAGTNIASVVDNGTGDVTVNFTSALPSANYVVAGSAGYAFNASQNNIAKVGPSRKTATPLTISSARLGVTNNTTGTEVSFDSPLLGVAFIGG